MLYSFFITHKNYRQNKLKNNSKNSCIYKNKFITLQQINKSYGTDI